ncbi:MAG: hypothetical protein LBV41_05705, partial [Cytophagaceae bacterium]|nr:hypothetical protein [Cytophagaceae bacterium]
LTDGVFTFGYTSTDGKVQVYPNCPKEIELKHVAYSSQIIDVSILPFQEITVLIKAKTIQLPDVNIYAKKERERYRKMGITKKRPFWGHLGYATSVFNHAQYIPNEDIRNNYILSAVHVYILSKGSPTLPFFVTLYKGEDETLAPNEKLKMAGPVYCKALQGDAYFTLDVTAYNLEMPKTGLFVMIEPAHKVPPVYGTVKIGKTEWQTSTNKNQVFIGSANQHVNTYRTWRDHGKGWKRSSFPPKIIDGESSIVGNPMIYLTMKKQKRK